MSPEDEARLVAAYIEGLEMQVVSTGRRTKRNIQAKAEAITESAEARLERLGRQRPEAFKSIWTEIGFVFSISMSQILTEFLVSGFTVIVPAVAKDLDIKPASSTWPASVFSLVVASFLLIFGRLADIYGGYIVYVGGLVWLTAWSLAAGFAPDQITLNLTRALQGLGSSAFLSSGVMILGTVYRPGPRKNIVFSIYGACAPLGFFLGILFAGITAEWTSWRWYFWIASILSAITALISFYSVPSDTPISRLKIKMDWLGGVIIALGLILFNFAIIDSSHAPNRWQNPYIIIFFIIGSLLLIAAAYIETYVASQPLIPPCLFKVPSMAALISALFLTYGSFGIFLLYGTFYMKTIMGANPLQILAWYIPLALGGCFTSTFGGLILHRIPGTILILVAGISWIIAPLLFAIAPQGANYWAYIFPAMILATIGIDTTINVSNVFFTTSLPKSQQGLAGAVASLVLHLGISICLGFSDIINTYTVECLGVRKSYHAVFWFEVACASTALVILTLGVKIKKAESELTVDEREVQEDSSGDRSCCAGAEDCKEQSFTSGNERIGKTKECV